jgi:hypothetical protein
MGSMLAMSMIATHAASFESDKIMPWTFEELEDASFTFDIEKYISNTPCKATNQYAWSRLILWPPNLYPQHEEHIALASIQPQLAPYADSDCSFCESEDTDYSYNPGYIRGSKADPEPLTFNIHFEDRTYVKQLDYGTFARWENVEALLEGFECEGAVVKRLWDVREDMPICRGDWDARVYPGLEVDVACWKTEVWDHDSALGSDSEEDGLSEVRALHGIHAHRKRWWFESWRRKVEQEIAKGSATVRDPSQKTLVLGILAMATFLGIVLVFCSI